MAMEMAAFSRFTRTFKAGELIFSEFEPGDTFYFIRSGRVKLVKLFGDMERTLDILHPSEMFGEMAILDHAPRSATAIALDVVQALEFNAQSFEILMLSNPQIAFKLLKMFTKRIYDSKRRFMILTLPDSQAKVADVFVMLDETQADIDKTTESREFSVSAEDVANWAGTSAAETKEILTHFSAQQRLELFPDRIVVKNINDFSRFVNAKRNQTE